MFSLSEYGRTVYLQAIESKIRKMHLFTDVGELVGYGYTPLEIDSKQFRDGVYPDILWTFAKGEDTRVLGYYVTDINGKVLHTEQFDLDENSEDMLIGGRNDRIRISMVLRFFSRHEVV